MTAERRGVKQVKFERLERRKLKQFELSDEEIRACKARELIIYRPEDVEAYPPDRAIAQAAQKKIVEWGEEPCPGHRNEHEDTDTLMYLGKARWDCFVCRQSIRTGLDKEEG